VTAMVKDARAVYREAAVRGATPVGLVVLLYEQAIQDLQGALSAIEQNDIERRTREMNHALSIIGQLQGTLNMEQGGESAVHLYRFYEQFKANLLKAQILISPDLLRSQITDLLELREAWLEVDRSLEQAKRSTDMTLDRPNVGNRSTKWTI
jgi:flagellar secretion chaperone FliS